MNNILKKELGAEESKTVKNPIGKEAVPQSNENPVEDRYKKTSEDSSFLWAMVKVFLVLGILAGGLYYILRMMNRKEGNKFPLKDPIRVLGSQNLAPGKQIQIIEVSGLIYIVGLGDSSVNLISEITIPDIKNKLLLDASISRPPEEGGFLEQLLKNFKNTDKTIEDARPGKEGRLEDIKKKQVERLKRLKEGETASEDRGLFGGAQ